MKKWIRRIYIGLFVFVILVIVAVNIGMDTMQFTDEDAMEYFQKRKFEGIIENKVVNGRSVKIISENKQESDSILLVFVHGAPGTWDAFKEYMTDPDLMDRSRVVAYDRPGYGGSGAEAMPSIQEQADILDEIVRLHGLKRNILVGHSYGGPISGKVGLESENNIDATIMIAPLIDPESEPLHWYSYFSYWKLTSWLLPSELVVAGSEKFAHSKELDLMKDQWQNAKDQFIHVHGLEDGLAPGKENIEFSKRHIPKENLETIVYDDKGHLIIWTEFEMMKDIILKTIDQL